MTHIREADIPFYNKYYGQLIGAKILEVEFAKDADFGDIFPTFTVELADGTKRQIELSQDEEGNGPGHLSGLDHPGPVT